MESLEKFKDEQNNIIITFCNDKYIPKSQKWIYFIKKLNINNYVIISYDKTTYDYFTDNDTNTILVEPDYINEDKDFFKNFMYYRTNVLRQILNKGYNILHSDMDAYWIKNIIPELNPDMDISVSQGTIWPRSHLSKHKFVMCCGIYYVKSNEKTKFFFDEFTKVVKNEEKDDQKPWNETLIDTKWSYDGYKNGKNVAHKYIYFDKDIYGYNKKYDLNICLIEMEKIQRFKLNNNGYIYHYPE